MSYHSQSTDAEFSTTEDTLSRGGQTPPPPTLDRASAGLLAMLERHSQMAYGLDASSEEDDDASDSDEI